MTNHEALTKMYEQMSEERLQEEIDALFEIIFAVLEATESDSIEAYPNTNIKLSFRCDVLKDEGRYIC